METLVSGIILMFELAWKVWWIILPPFFVYLAVDTWKYYLATKALKEAKWVLLEIRLPREILKTPDAMERVFAGFHGPYDPPEKFKDFFLEPKARLWYNLEIVGQGGDIRFFAYVPKGWRNVVEATMYAQYPDITIVEADDYTKAIPDDLPNEYDLWGTEMALGTDQAYPILTYKDFTVADTQVEKEEQKVDPLSAFSEILAKLRPGEQIWYQILARPCGRPGVGDNDLWQDKSKEVADKLAGKPAKKKADLWYGWLVDLLSIFGEEAREISRGVITQGETSAEAGLARLGAPPKKEEKKDEPPSKMQHLTPGEKNVVEAIERKASKPGFECVIRMMYVARRDTFSKANIASIFGMIKQFNTLNLNSFKPNGDTLTKKYDYLGGLIQSKRYEVKMKRGLLYSYKNRSLFYDVKEPVPANFFPALAGAISGILYRLFPSAVEVLRSKIFVLNTEELATIYHFPGKTVSSPLMSRMQVKQVAAPTNLPTG